MKIKFGMLRAVASAEKTAFFRRMQSRMTGLLAAHVADNRRTVSQPREQQEQQPSAASVMARAHG